MNQELLIIRFLWIILRGFVGVWSRAGSWSYGGMIVLGMDGGGGGWGYLCVGVGVGYFWDWVVMFVWVFMGYRTMDQESG